MFNSMLSEKVIMYFDEALLMLDLKEPITASVLNAAYASRMSMLVSAAAHEKRTVTGDTVCSF